MLVELFLQELGPKFVARPTVPEEVGYDFFAGFQNQHGGRNIIAVAVKATEQPVGDDFPVRRTTYEQWIHSNIPVLLLVFDVKLNESYFAWLSDAGSDWANGASSVGVKLSKIQDEQKTELRRRLAN